MTILLRSILYLFLMAAAWGAPDSGYHSLTAGSAHTCVLNSSGAAYCWGQNIVGQLGNGTGLNSTTPVAVAGGLTFSTLGGGGDTTCGITTTGAAYCWGDGTFGQLGGVAPSTCLSVVPCALTPVPVSGSLTFAKISSNVTHSCAVTPASVAYCWGDNGSGELGQGNYTGPDTCSGRPCYLSPTAVLGGQRFTTITAGNGTTCAIAITSQTLYCWGDGQFDRIPAGIPQTGQTLPTAAAGAGLKFTSVAIGAFAGCGALTHQDEVRCWGGSIDGALGATIIPEFCATTGLGSFSCSSNAIPVAEDLGGADGDRSVSMTRTTVCALSNKRAFCWGRGIDGQLGIGSSPAQSLTPVEVSGKLKFVELAVGSAHSCGVTEDGRVYCWGGGVSNAPVQTLP